MDKEFAKNYKNVFFLRHKQGLASEYVKKIFTYLIDRSIFYW